MRDIRVKLSEHALQRLVERAPDFINFRFANSQNGEEIISLLNERYSRGILFRQRHKDMSNFKLGVPSLGVFWMTGEGDENQYIAGTMKPVYNEIRFMGRNEEVTISYSTIEERSCDEYGRKG